MHGHTFHLCVVTTVDETSRKTHRHFMDYSCWPKTSYLMIVASITDSSSTQYDMFIIRQLSIYIVKVKLWPPFYHTESYTPICLFYKNPSDLFAIYKNCSQFHWRTDSTETFKTMSSLSYKTSSVLVKSLDNCLKAQTSLLSFSFSPTKNKNDKF